ncbi:MAG: biotin transporter BioY [Frisingicoccus sp.]
MVLALAVCYAFGTVWFMIVYAKMLVPSASAVLGWCVIPFIIPDLAKIALAFILSNRISKAVTL